MNKCPAAFPPHKRGIRITGRNRELCPISKVRKYFGKCRENRNNSRKVGQTAKRLDCVPGASPSKFCERPKGREKVKYLILLR